MSVRRRRWGLFSLLLSSLALAWLGLRTVVPAEWGLRLVLDSFLPWTAIPIVCGFACACASRRILAIVVASSLAIVWGVSFIPRLLPLGGTADGDTGLSIVTQNLGEDSSTISTLIEGVIAPDPDVIVLQEITTGTLDDVDARLASAGYDNSDVEGTVGVWSRLELSGAIPLSLGLTWTRALRVDVQTPVGVVRLYALHAASARVTGREERDTMLSSLATLLAGDGSSRVVVAGDFNATIDDEAMMALLDYVEEPKSSGGGFGFTWPSAFPATRPDHILIRGLSVSENRVLSASGSDHRGIFVHLVG